MASINQRPVIGDSGSQESAQLRKNYNALLDVLGNMITALKTAADAPAINAIAVIAETALQNTVEKIVSQKDLPLNPLRPDLHPGLFPRSLEP